MSQRDLARRAYINPSYVARIEQGDRQPSPEVAEAIDKALNAAGTLAALAEPPEPDPATAATRESLALSRLLTPQGIPGGAELAEGTSGLAVAYLAQPAGRMLTEAGALRRTALQALRLRRIRRPADIADTTLHAGYLSGVLAYAAVDLGDATGALTHAGTAWNAAEAVGDDQLRAWVRGTQSLILRFAGDYPAALDAAMDGLGYAHAGTGRMRLLCGIAQCHANLGDARAARSALAAAGTARDRAHGTDRLPGLFRFSPAKQAYYSGSSLIWLDTLGDAAEAAEQARQAIELWSTSGPDDRSLDDEALAHVYLATAALQLGDLEQAAAALEPILSLPAERRISWIVKRLDRVVGMLSNPPYASDPAARSLRERIAEQ